MDNRFEVTAGAGTMMSGSGAHVVHAGRVPGLRRQVPGTVLGMESSFWRRIWP
jgi:hypothetical protein